MGPSRFWPKTKDTLYRVSAKVDTITFRLREANDSRKENPFTQHASTMVKIDMPELELESGQKRVVEIYDNTEGDWKRRRIDRFGIDGQVMLMPQKQKESTTEEGEGRLMDNPPAVWIDLSEEHYRWVA